MLHKTYLRCLALVVLGFANGAAIAEGIDPLEDVMVSLNAYPSGFSAARGKCAPTLTQGSDQALKAMMIAPGKFAQSSVAQKIKALHTVADSWYRTALVDHDRAYFRTEYAVQQFDWFVRRVHTLNGVPLMKLKPFAHELRVISIKIEPIVHLYVRHRVEYITNLRNLFERTGRLPGTDQPLDHALRSIVYAQAAFLAFTQPDASRTGERTVVHGRSSEHQLALEKALHLMRTSVREDELGFRWSRYVPYAAALLPILVADYVTAAPAGRPAVELDVIEIVSDIHRGVRGMIKADGPAERRQLARLVVQLDTMIHQNAALSRQVPGFVARVEQIQALLRARPSR